MTIRQTIDALDIEMQFHRAAVRRIDRLKSKILAAARQLAVYESEDPSCKKKKETKPNPNRAA